MRLTHLVMDELLYCIVTQFLVNKKEISDGRYSVAEGSFVFC